MLLEKKLFCSCQSFVLVTFCELQSRSPRTCAFFVCGAWEALYVEVVKDGLSVSEMMKLLDQALNEELTLKMLRF